MSLIKEEQPEVKLQFYYGSKFTFDLDKFIAHLDWHYFLATIAEGDNRG
jgi:hypothetical protein